MKRLALTFFSSFICLSVYCQNNISIKNASFERIDLLNFGLENWTYCGTIENSFSNSQLVLPVFQNDFITSRPSEGNGHISLVTRDNHTWDKVEQKLDQPLIAGNHYKIALNLSRAAHFVGVSTKEIEAVQYTHPVKLKILGAKESCGEGIELSSTSATVKNIRWFKYEFLLSPQEDFHFLQLECTYGDIPTFDYNGNLMIDNISPILQISGDAARKFQAQLPYLKKEDWKVKTKVPKDLAQKIERTQAVLNKNKGLSQEEILNVTLLKFLNGLSLSTYRDALSAQSQRELLLLAANLKRNPSFRLLIIGIHGNQQTQEIMRKVFAQFLKKNKAIDFSLQLQQRNKKESTEGWSIIGKKHAAKIIYEN